MSMSKPEIKMRIERQLALLKGRQEEYKIFGRASADVEKDVEIINEIKRLKSKLKAKN